MFGATDFISYIVKHFLHPVTSLFFNKENTFNPK